MKSSIDKLNVIIPFCFLIGLFSIFSLICIGIKQLFDIFNEEDIEVAELQEGKIIYRGDGWYVVSEKTGKNLGGPYSSYKKALERLREIEYFKNKG